MKPLHLPSCKLFIVPAGRHLLICLLMNCTVTTANHGSPREERERNIRGPGGRSMVGVGLDGRRRGHGYSAGKRDRK